MVLLVSGCQLSETPISLSTSGGPTLHAFSDNDGITLIWNSYLLPYYNASNEVVAPLYYEVLVSDTSPDELVSVEDTDDKQFEFLTSDNKPYWFAVDAVYDDGTIARSNIVMSTSSDVEVSQVAEVTGLTFAAGYSMLSSGLPLFESINSQGNSEIRTILPSESSSILTDGRSPVPHPFLNQFLYISGLDNSAISTPSDHTLLLWNQEDSSVMPLVNGSGFIDKPNWDAAGQRIVYLSSATEGEPTSLRVVELDTLALTVSLVTTPNDVYSGAGVEGPNNPSFFPGRDAVVIDIPSIESGSIGRNIQLKSIVGGSDSVLVQSPWLDTQPLVHPSGRKMVFVSERAGSAAIWLLELSSGDLRQVTGHLGDPIVSREHPLVWSADGTGLWFTGTIGEYTSCFFVGI